MKRLLHLNSYYFTNRIHYYFRKELERQKTDISIEYFVPTYLNAKRAFDDSDVCEYRIYSRFDKLFFFSKILKSFFYIRKKNIKSVSLIHAHTLISDGLLAYLLLKFYKVPYVVTIRNTDINYFLPNFMFRYLGKKVLNCADQVICLSPCYKSKLNKVYSELYDHKISILPNGLNKNWIEEYVNSTFFKKLPANVSKINLLFVGRVDSNKNIKIILDFLKIESNRSYVLNIVGVNSLNIDFQEFNRTLTNLNSVNYLGQIDSEERLMQIYRENDIFILLSFKESFGISYIEAISQGTPIIYTENEGVSGFFDGKKSVGKSCNPLNLWNLRLYINEIVENYYYFSYNAINESKQFKWESIIARYLNILKL